MGVTEWMIWTKSPVAWASRPLTKNSPHSNLFNVPSHPYFLAIFLKNPSLNPSLFLFLCSLEEELQVPPPRLLEDLLESFSPNPLFPFLGLEDMASKDDPSEDKSPGWVPSQFRVIVAIPNDSEVWHTYAH